jgi:hypothetical protein
MDVPLKAGISKSHEEDDDDNGEEALIIPNLFQSPTLQYIISEPGPLQR